MSFVVRFVILMSFVVSVKGKQHSSKTCLRNSFILFCFCYFIFNTFIKSQEAG